MSRTRWIVAVAAWIAVVTGAVAAWPGSVGTAWAQDKLTAEHMQLWGGTYLSDCAKNTSARITVFADALVFIEGNKRVATPGVTPQASFFGNSSPEDFRTALVGEYPDGSQLIALVYEDDKGKYITIDGDTKSLNQISAAARKMKYRLCGAVSEKKSGTAAGTEPGAGSAGATAGVGAGKPAPDSKETASGAAQELPDAVGMITDPGFKAAYTKALGKYSKEPWLAEMDGPTSPSRKTTVDGVEYLVVSSCKSHDCYDNNTVVLYSAAKKVAYGKVLVAGKSAMIGNPPPPIAKEIGAQWFQQWRSTP